MTISTEGLRKLLDETTPGPWRVYDSARGGTGVGVTPAGDRPDICAMSNIYDERRGHDAALIALTPTIASELLHLRERMEAAEKLAEAAQKVRAAMEKRSPMTGHLSQGDIIASHGELCTALAAWEVSK
ncbi:MAG: hypothetical protein ACRCUC_11180 [Aestuariivirga sp.]